MNLKTLINQATVLDDEMAWGLIEPELEKGYDVKLWRFASKIATRLNNYHFLSGFYKNFLIADPINPTIFFKLLDSLLKAEYYNDFIEHLQEAQKNNILSTELIEKIYARFAGQICKYFLIFSDETLLFLLDSIVNLKTTYDTDFTQKIFNNFIKSILSKGFNDKKNLIFLEKAVDLSDFVHSKILINITANFIKQNNYVLAYSLLHRIFIIDPFNAKGFMYAIALYEKDVLYSPLIIQWLDYLENEPKTKEHEILNYALCLMYKQDFIKADSVFEKALENFNASEDIIFHYAENLFFLDKFHEATIFIKKHEDKIIKLNQKLFQLKAQIALAIYDVHALENTLDNAEENNLSNAYIIKILLALQKNEEAYKIYQNFNIIKELYTIFPNKKFPFEYFEKNNCKPVQGKMVVLNCILGLGDELRFACFFPMVSKICTNVKIVCDSRLYNLRRRQFPKNSFIPINKINPCFNSNPIKNILFYRDFNNEIYDLVQEADYVVTFTQLLEPLLRLENFFEENNKARRFLTFFKNYFLKNPNKPNIQQSLKPRPDIQSHWRNWLDSLPKKPKIGLFWRADVSQLSYHHKKSNLKDWIELLNDLQIVIIPLQYGLSTTEISLMHYYPDLFFTPPNLDLKNDIDGLSGLISVLDYVVTTAGTTQHLAGALNKTVLACVHPYEVYWRCNANATKDRFAPNVHILFSKPSEGIKGSMNVTVKKLKEILTHE